MICAQSTGRQDFAYDPGDVQRPGYDRLPDAHVVPLGDARLHAVPGGYDEGETTAEHPDDREWLAIAADPDVPTQHCPCWPSVRAVRHAGGLGRVVIHAAADGRSTGGNP